MSDTLSRIPIRNIYHLLCYAWRVLTTASPLGLEPDEGEDAPVQDLLARMLIGATRAALRRGLIRGYLSQEETLRMVRGKIFFPDTLRRTLLPVGLVACKFDEFLPDILPNQLIKATLRLLSRTENVDGPLRHQLAGLAHRLGGISDVQVHPSNFKELSLHRNNSHYRLLMALCELIWDLTLPKEGDGKVRCLELLQHKDRMHQLFENFIFGFYLHHLKKPWHVCHRKTIDWWMAEDEEAKYSLLPGMEADVVIENPLERIVIETKFYQEALVAGPFDASEKIRSAHLYQLHAYLSNLSAVPSPPIRGILLYPVVQAPIHEHIPLNRHAITVHAVNLNQGWVNIEAELMMLMGIETAQGGANSQP